jgi:mRNA interferase MazF
VAFDRFDVVVAPFPFTDVNVSKRRPVLVLTKLDFNIAHRHLIGCMITTAAASHWPSDHPIADLELAGLSHRSVVRWKVFTLPMGLIVRRLGSMGSTDREAIAHKHTQVFGYGQLDV